MVVLSGDDLYFGERVTDTCSADGRPQALGAYPWSVCDRASRVTLEVRLEPRQRIAGERLVFEWVASHGNAGGWMFMMSALKAYLEYGINLRAGGVV